MNWTSVAILSAAILGVVNTLDSHIISRRVPSLRSYLLLAGIIHLIYALILLYLIPFPEGISVRIFLVATVSGILRATAVTFMLYAMKREEISQIIPVIYTYPVFVAIMAVPLLGESLRYMQWLAVIIVVVGAVMVSAKKSPSGSTTWLGRMFLLLFGVSLLFAMSDIASKYALAYISSWNMYTITAFCLAAIFLLPSIRPHTFREVDDIRRQRWTMALIVFNETLAPVGIAMVLWAVERGPVSLVSTITASRPIFVAIYAMIMTRISPRFLIRSTISRGLLALRLAATAMIVGGIAIIFLT